MSSETMTNLTLEFSETSAQKFIAAIQGKHGIQDVEKVVVFSYPYPDFGKGFAPFAWGETPEDWSQTPDVPESFEQALRHLVELPKLRSFELRFTKECAVQRLDDWFWREVPETEEYRTSMLDRVFKALDRLNNVGRPIESIAVKNLQNTKITSVAESVEFKRVMANVKQLHLSICTEYDDASPESSIERPEYLNYPAELSAEWLDPVRAHLTHLSLYWDTFFGLIPTFPDPGSKHFPKLKSLTLGNYAFGSDMQLDWILSHADTLEELIMDENAITHNVIVLSAEEVKNFGLDAHFTEYYPSATSDVAVLCKYGKQWHEYFDALRQGLPHLRHFRFGSNWHAPPGTVNAVFLHEFEHRDEVKTELFPGRYVVFDSGIGPTQWLGPDEDGSYANAFGETVMTSPAGECHEKDQEALDRLMEMVDARGAASPRP